MGSNAPPWGPHDLAILAPTDGGRFYQFWSSVKLRVGWGKGANHSHDPLLVSLEAISLPPAPYRIHKGHSQHGSPHKSKWTLRARPGQQAVEALPVMLCWTEVHPPACESDSGTWRRRTSVPVPESWRLNAFHFLPFLGTRFFLR